MAPKRVLDLMITEMKAKVKMWPLAQLSPPHFHIDLDKIPNSRVLTKASEKVVNLLIPRSEPYLCRVAEVVRRHEGPSPKSLNSDKKFKP